MKDKPSVVRSAVEALRKLALETDDGELLGSEEELVTVLNISRPTLRQASALLVQEQLVRVRRGVGGGYFARRPDSSAVAHMAAIYLLIHGAGLEEIVNSVGPIRSEMARLAARNSDPEIRRQFVEFIENERQIDLAGPDYRQFIKAERAFSQLLGQASENRVLSLFLQILYDFAGLLTREQDVYVNRPDRVENYRATRNMMAEAILGGDGELAALAARRCSQAVSAWMLEDMDQNGETSIAMGDALAQTLARSGIRLGNG